MKKYNPKPYQLPDYPDTDTEVMEKESSEVQEILNLVIFDDDQLTFTEVEEALQIVCHYTEMESKRLSRLIHENGKTSVKQGSYKKLKPMLEAMLDRKISAIIE